jgi:hypothetical protein
MTRKVPPRLMRERKARRDKRCVHCGGVILKGEAYTLWRGYPDQPQHTPSCPPKN